MKLYKTDIVADIEITRGIIFFDGGQRTTLFGETNDSFGTCKIAIAAVGQQEL